MLVKMILIPYLIQEIQSWINAYRKILS